MEKALSTLEISNRMVELALAKHGETEQSNLTGSTHYVTRGYLVNGRYASVRITKTHPMVHVGLNVPGAGGMGIHFSLFADEATDERMERYLDHYLGLHEMAAEKFKRELEASAA